MSAAAAGEPEDPGASEHARRDVLLGELCAALTERRRLANRLHDGAHQLLLSAGMRIHLLEEDAPVEQRAELAEIARQLAAAREELRTVSLELGPSIGHRLLAEALRHLVDDTAADAGWSADFVDHGTAEVSDGVYVTVVSATHGALRALQRLCDIAHLSVTLDTSGVSVVVDIDGRFVEGGAGRCLDDALLPIHDRVALVGGTADITRDDGDVAVRIRIPPDGQPGSEVSEGRSRTNTDPAGSPAR